MTGFMSYISAEMAAVLHPIKITTKRANFMGGGADTTYDVFWLASVSQMNMQNTNASPDDGDVPVGSGDFSPVAGQNGVLVKDVGTYICRQISSPDGVTVDFEAMVRVGQDNALPDAPVNKSFWKNQFYRSAADGTLKRLTDYPTTPTIPPAPAGTRIRGTSTADMFGKFYRPLIVEFSWPIDVVWSKREKRVIRMDIFNENFVPYPPSP